MSDIMRMDLEDAAGRLSAADFPAGRVSDIRVRPDGMVEVTTRAGVLRFDPQVRPDLPHVAETVPHTGSGEATHAMTFNNRVDLEQLGRAWVSQINETVQHVQAGAHRAEPDGVVRRPVDRIAGLLGHESAAGPGRSAPAGHVDGRLGERHYLLRQLYGAHEVTRQLELLDEIAAVDRDLARLGFPAEDLPAPLDAARHGPDVTGSHELDPRLLAERATHDDIWHEQPWARQGRRISLDELIPTSYGEAHKWQSTMEQIVAELLRGRTFAGFEVRVDLENSDVTAAKNTVKIRAVIVDAEGHVQGSTRRTFTREFDPDGGYRIVVRHDSLELHNHVRGGGFAKEWNEFLHDWYRESGVDRVELRAGSTVGGYAWARDGYTWHPNAPHGAEGVFERLRDELRNLAGDLRRVEDWRYGDQTVDIEAIRQRYGSPEPGALHTELLRQWAEADQLLDRTRNGFLHGDYPTPREVSELGRQSGQHGKDATWLGKRVLLGSVWEGVKPLDGSGVRHPRTVDVPAHWSAGDRPAGVAADPVPVARRLADSDQIPAGRWFHEPGHPVDEAMRDVAHRIVPDPRSGDPAAHVGPDHGGAVGQPDRSLPERDSPERVAQQELSDAILTADGHVTASEHAKTLVIEALAERMPVRTDQMVQAAIGRDVGSDLANRLGDEKYVLVPINARYPSMGAHVVHVSELDPTNPWHTPDKVIRMDDPRAEVLVRQIAVSELLGAWAHGGNSNARVLAIQEAAIEEFGLGEHLDWRMDPVLRQKIDLELLYNRDVLRAFLRTQYELTQADFAARGVTEVLIYRGMSWPAGEHPEWMDSAPGTRVDMLARPLSSWSGTRDVVLDWLHTLREPGVVVVDRVPVTDIVSHPQTGMGCLWQREFVYIGSGRPAIDEFFPGRGAEADVPPPAVDHPDGAGKPVADHYRPGDEARWEHQDDGPPHYERAGVEHSTQWDHRVDELLDAGQGADFPDWWPADDSGYHIQRRDLDYLGLTADNLRDFIHRDAPLGMTPGQYRQYRAELLGALRLDGIEPHQIDLRLKGSSAEFFSGLHKELPGSTHSAVTGDPRATAEMRAWFGDDPHHPLRRPFDSMHRLGLESVPSDYDMNLSSTTMVDIARRHWPADRYVGDFMGGHGYVDKDILKKAFPELMKWKERWEEILEREVSLGLFESSGPFDGTRWGPPISVHFRDTDWIIHRPEGS
jgi:hypothetical protein